MDILRANLTPESLIAHNKDSFNALFANGLSQIISKSYRVENTFSYPDNNVILDNVVISKASVAAEFSDVKIVADKHKKGHLITPYTARQGGHSYSSEISATMDITVRFYDTNGEVVKTKTSVLYNFVIGSIPLMVKSNDCILNVRSKTDVDRFEYEDINDPGGYFIIKGNEWTIDTTENITFNIPHIYNNNHKAELTRLEFISKAGDAFENSKQLIMLINSNKSITLNLASNLDFIKKAINFPIRIIFVLLGVKNDYEIFKLVNPDDDVDVKRVLMNSYLYEPKGGSSFKAVMNEYDANKIAVLLGKAFLKVANTVSTKVVSSADQINNNNDIVNKFMSTIDNSLFPHIGVTESERRAKCIYMATLVRKMILIHLKRLPESNRDSYISKRLHSTGLSLSKGFKQSFKTITVNAIRKCFSKAYRVIVNKNVDSLNSGLYDIDIAKNIQSDYKPETLTDALEKSITASEAFKKKYGKNHLSTQNLNRKNFLNALSVMRNIHTNNTNAGAKSKRATEMRAVQPSYTGYVCPVASADTGEKVGLSKQIAITARITNPADSSLVKEYIKTLLPFTLSDVVTMLDNDSDFDYKIFNNVKVFVNGDLIGYTDTATELVQQLREARRNPTSKLRNNELAPKDVTIHLDIFNTSVNIWVDLGRVVRPLLIVYSDGNRQFIKYDEKIHAGMKFNELCDLGIMEYISCEESENCYIAYNIDQLKQDENSVIRKYTHCEIEQALLGITALTSPFLNHTMATRCTYQTNQAKQACGIYCLNPHRRYDRKKALQNYCEQPLIPTLINDIVYPNGQNLVVAMMCHTGYNQEDSTIINKSTADKGYLAVTNYTYETVSVMSNNETIRKGLPTDKIQTTTASKEFLDENGIIKKGSIIKNNTVLVSKLKLISSVGNDPSYTDQSLIYTGLETVEVDDIYEVNRNNIVESVKVRLKSIRKIIPGDKLSTRSGNKNIVSVLLPESEMPYIARNGVIPDMIVNPHSVPTRMVIGQLIEAIYAKLATQKAQYIDGTVFSKVNVDEIRSQLSVYGINEFGLEKMVCGITGKIIESLIFVCPTYIQRLQKFAIDEIYIANRGPVDEITHQPKEGRSNSGGLKIGEMEKDSIAGNGISNCFKEKLLQGLDRTIEYVCNKCGCTSCVVNVEKDIMMCPDCQIPQGDIYAVNTNYVNVIFKDILRTLGVDMRYKVEA